LDRLAAPLARGALRRGRAGGTGSGGAVAAATRRGAGADGNGGRLHVHEPIGRLDRLGLLPRTLVGRFGGGLLGTSDRVGSTGGASALDRRSARASRRDQLLGVSHPLRVRSRSQACGWGGRWDGV